VTDGAAMKWENRAMVGTGADEMKMLGLIGGLSWESTAIYYRLLNEGVRQRLGGLHSARLLLWSFDFAEIAQRQANGEWDRLVSAMINAGERLYRSGAEALMICSNTMHLAAPALAKAIPVPLIHIGEATGRAICRSSSRRPLLLGTRFTMEQGFYIEYLSTRFDLNLIIPAEPFRGTVHEIIYQELCRGLVQPQSRHRFLEGIADMRSRGVDGVIFGCTEIGLLLRQSDFDMPTFDTTAIHVEAALDFALPRTRD
jgi:aspartate racemase